MRVPLSLSTCIAFFGAAVLSAAPVPGKPKPLNVQRFAAQGALRFEPNVGQASAPARFVARGAGYSLSLADDGLAMTLGAQNVVRMRLRHGQPSLAATFEDKLPSVTNYYLGDDPKQWHPAVPNYGRVRFQEVYPGIDIVYYGNEGKLEYDFIVKPDADPDQIKLSFSGADSLRLNPAGDLVLAVNGKELIQKKPVLYQEANGHRVEIAGHYELFENNQVRLALADYDRSRRLVIDPVFIYSTYLGGAGSDVATGIAVDSSGSAYITGYAAGGFPTLNAAQPAIGGGATDVFVTKLTPAGSLSYSTYLGGIGDDSGNGIAVDASGSAYITGSTTGNFPVLNALQPAYGGGLRDAFVAKLTPAGSLSYSTYVGGAGNDSGNGIAVDASGSAYIAGETSSLNFPTLNAGQPTYGGDASDAFVAKLTPAGSLSYSTYLGGVCVRTIYGGGCSGDSASSIAVDASGAAYVAGYTSGNFPTLNAAQPSFGGGGRVSTDAFVTKLTPAGLLSYSTYLGGYAEDSASGIAVDSSGSAYITGRTASANFPLLNAAQPLFGGASDAFVTKLTPAGLLSYSTYFGGNDYDYGSGIAVDASSNAYISANHFTSSYPLPDVFHSLVRKINPAGALRYFTDLGGINNDSASGIAVDTSGNAYITGSTAGGFPVSNAVQPGYGGGAYDAFVAKINVDFLAATLTAPVNTTISGPSVAFSWGAITTATGYWLDVGTAAGSGNLCASGEITGLTFTCDKVPTTAGSIYVKLWTKMAGAWTGTEYIFTTATGGILTSPAPSTQLSSTSVAFAWSALTGATAYWLDIGTAAGQGDICASGVITALTYLCTGIPASAGATIHAQLWTLESGVWSNQRFTYLAPVALAPATLTAPAPGSLLGSANATFTWSVGTGIDAYWLDVGTALGQGNVSSGLLTTTSKAVSGIPTTGATLFVRLWSRNAATGSWLIPIDYTYKTVVVDPLIGLQTPASGSTFPGSTVTFTWAAVAGADSYWLDVGPALGSGAYSSGPLTALTKTVTGLPCTGAAVYVRLWTHIGANWQTTPLDYKFTQAASCSSAATLTAPAAGTTITGSSATFTWTAVAGAGQYWLDVGTALGQGNLSSGATTALTKTVTTLPNDGKPLYIRLWTNIGGTWQTPIDYLFATGTDNRAALSTPAPGSRITGPTATFTWTNGSAGVDGYWLDVGTALGQGNLSNGLQTTTTKTVTTLPNAGGSATVYIRLWTRIAGAWQTPIDYTFTN